MDRTEEIGRTVETPYRVVQWLMGIRIASRQKKRFGMIVTSSRNGVLAKKMVKSLLEHGILISARYVASG
jgi:translation initiation factor 2B subunit (eIF-2B alpha/beta/delta family)